MGELSEECAVLATDGADEKEEKRLRQLLQVKTFKGKYALPIEGTETADSSAVYRAVPDPSNPTQTMLGEPAIPQFPHIKSTYLLLKEAARIFGRNLYVGERQPIKDSNSQTTLSDFKYFTYADTLRMVEALGRALDQEVGVPLSHYDEEGLNPAPKPLRVLGLWSRTRMDWRLLDFAANYRGIVTVPLYDTLGEPSVKHIVKLTKMEVLAAEGSKLDAALQLKKEGFPLKAVISFDEPTQEQIDAFREAGVSLYHQEKLRRRYLTIPDTKKPEELEPSLDDICTIIFTSGTTGLPKGAVHTNSSLLSFVGSYIGSSNRMQVFVGDSTLSYLPLAHIYQRGVELVVTLLGIRVAYYSGDMLKLAEDVQLAKPSVFIAVPRVFNKISSKINAGIRNKHPFLQWLAGKALNNKVQKYKLNPRVVTSFLPDLLFRNIRASMGGNIRTVCVGSAPMDPQQLLELQLYLSAVICEGWGMTETGICFLQSTDDSNKGTIGGPLVSTEFKVVSLPGLQYDARGNPPRGELLVRGPSLMKEYFLAADKTAETFDKDQWLHTGDVVEIQPSGAVKIIDRVKNVFKLAHGEYIAPERLENIYSASRWVEQIFVYGDSLEAVLVAIIVPSPTEVRKWAEKNNKAGEPMEALLKDEALKAEILKDLELLGRAQLKGFELIRAIWLTDDTFTPENGLLTPTMKLIRHAAKNRFIKEIKELYSSLNLCK